MKQPVSSVTARAAMRDASRRASRRSGERLHFIPRIAGALIVAAALSGPATARDITFPISNGGRVTVAPLEDVTSCQQAERIQTRIDQSGYRRGSPSSVTDPRDRELLRYEQALARKSFDLCPSQRALPERVNGYAPQPRTY